MIGAMPRPRPPYLHHETTRHKRRVWYVRIGRGPRIRLKADFGTPQFEAEYQAAIRGERPPQGEALRVLVDGRSLATVERRPGCRCRSPQGDNAKTFFSRLSRQRGGNHSRLSPKARLRPAGTDAAPHQHKRGISSTLCAVYLHGQRKPNL